VDELGGSIALAGLVSERIGDDVLLTGYIHEP
jgi:hypothetical protein